jgi:uncharacterized phage protein (TIGR01671 family)
MKREIKFRVWDTKYKKMVFTGFHFFGEIMAFDEVRIYLFETKETDHISTIERWNDLELMQFTGLLDKNGKEIYEGDIVEQVFHGVENESTLIEVKDIRHLSELYIGSTKSNLVIGNIYENPELLK